MSLKNIFKEYIKQKNLNFSFHKIWQEELTADLIDKFDKVFNGFRIEGFNTQTNLLNKGLCYADQDHSATINFNGDVFKCTARDFLPDNRLGVLLDDGTISWGEVYKTRQDSKYKSKTCRTCKLFPICMQGCSQNAFENIGNDSCNLGYTEDYINKIISDRIRYLLK